MDTATKNFARGVVRNELDCLRISRPSVCEECGGSAELNRYGRSKIHAHHKDYSRPLDVEWLCVSCHLKRDIPYGETHHFAKLNRVQIKSIFELRRSGWTHKKISELFNVSKQTIARVLKKKTWIKTIKELKL